MTTRERPTRVGALRPSAVMHTFGIGAVVDLPRLSVMLMGQDEWAIHMSVSVEEPRLVDAVRAEPGLEGVVRLLMPPVADETSPLASTRVDASRLVGVPVAVFPRWMLCPVCRKLAPIESDLWELQSNPVRPDRNRFLHRNCQKARTPPIALPARFVVACEDGHLDDFPWADFVHAFPPPDAERCPAKLRLDEIGPSGEVADIQVRCETCGQAQRMSLAFGEDNRKKLPPCSGANPHLRERGQPCEHRMRPMLLGASNAWFPVQRSVLSLPAARDPLSDDVARAWERLQHVTGVEPLRVARAMKAVIGFDGVSDEELFGAIERHRAGADDQGLRSIRGPEWELLTSPAPPENRDFRAREVDVPVAFADLIARVVLLERLREVQALLGFTRVEAPYDNEDGRAWTRLSRRDPDWLPAVEVHGEGIFVQLREDAVEEWCARPEVAERQEAFLEAHVVWRRRRNIENAHLGFPGLRMVLVHSLAHALMRHLALESGYSQSSIRERLYALPPGVEEGPMAGFLLYTAAPGTEGTLGGLVASGEPARLGRHLEEAFRDAALCASDPLCADHAPDLEGLALHGAACHACLFAPETSCERGNRFLDRAVLVPLVSGASLGIRAHIAV